MIAEGGASRKPGWQRWVGYYALATSSRASQTGTPSSEVNRIMSELLK
jgi:hypothetical protein